MSVFGGEAFQRNAMLHKSSFITIDILTFSALGYTEHRKSVDRAPGDETIKQNSYYIYPMHGNFRSPLHSSTHCPHFSLIRGTPHTGK